MTSAEILLLVALGGSVVPGGKSIGKQAYCLAISGKPCAKKPKHKKHPKPEPCEQPTTAK